MVLIYMALFTWALTETVNHGDLKLLKWLRELDDKIKNPILRLLTTPLRAAKCPFCFSHWSGGISAVLAVFLNGSDPFLAAFLALPATRLANVFNDVFWGFSRTGRTPEGILDGLEEEDIAAYFYSYIDEDRPKPKLVDEDRPKPRLVDEDD